ncbi:hypothetical protein [Streptomyces sp. Caat 7-52]|uniref:hypothetical protein n=1 Tax=Streptomyces sp. Caat 7-52 TaxID=2949637 RepID=UPI002036173F|nr:hypothetical protein [Streptomyces sp. Caat 7-52]
MTMPSGKCVISCWSDTNGEKRVLTASENGVTVAPPGAADEQTFSLIPGPDGTVAIQIPALIFPSRSLSYKEPEKGERVILGPLSDFPTREWRIEPAPQMPAPTPYFIRVPDKDLILVVSPKAAFPPELELLPSNRDLENAWAIIPVFQD